MWTYILGAVNVGMWFEWPLTKLVNQKIMKLFLKYCVQWGQKSSDLQNLNTKVRPTHPDLFVFFP